MKLGGREWRRAKENGVARQTATHTHAHHAHAPAQSRTAPFGWCVSPSLRLACAFPHSLEPLPWQAGPRIQSEGKIGVARAPRSPNRTSAAAALRPLRQIDGPCGCAPLPHSPAPPHSRVCRKSSQFPAPLAAGPPVSYPSKPPRFAPPSAISVLQQRTWVAPNPPWRPSRQLRATPVGYDIQIKAARTVDCSLFWGAALQFSSIPALP